MVYTFARILLPEFALVGGIGVALLTLVLTGLRGGLPLWQRWWLRLRGTILLSASAHPSSMLAELAQLLDLPLELAQIDGDLLFTPPQNGEIDLREWITFAQARDQEDDALRFVNSPLEELPA